MTAADLHPKAIADVASAGSDQPDECERLIRAARAGQADALACLIETWRTYLFHLADSEISPDLRRKLGASDLVQNACLDIHQRFQDFQGQTEAEWRVWLRRLLIHDLQDARRRFLDAEKRDLRRERPLGGAPALQAFDRHASPRASLIAEEEAQALRSALLRLPEEYRAVLRLRNWECLPFADIGRQMHRSEEAARKLWSRAVLRLQTELESDASQNQESR
jgi:RNA polymerase sigma-70 factor, ECF subfamily